MHIIRVEGFVLVANNARDFLKLFRREAVHPGLVVTVPGGVGAENQVRLFGLALDVVEPMPDIINKLLEVNAAGGGADPAFTGVVRDTTLK